MNSSRPTLKEISAEVGVSVALVSVVLNGKKGRIMASAKTREKIIAAAKALGYVPNRSARSLRLKCSFLIGVLAYNINTSFVPEILNGIENELLHTNFDMLLGTFHNTEELTERLEVFRKRNIDGLIILSGMAPGIRTLIQNHPDLPKVSISYDFDLPNCSSVKTDREELEKCAAEALSSRGHRIFGHLINSENHRSFFKKYFPDNNIPNAVHFEKICRNFFDEGFNAATELLKEHPDISAIFADSDILGSAAIKAAFAQGLRVPQDVSILGIDDSIICHFTSPELASISQQKREQGEKAAKILLDMLNGKPPVSTNCPVELVCRESLGKKCDK